MRRKGYHEAIDNYIDERTPVIEKAENGKFRLLVNGEYITEDADLSIHKALLELGSRYIYTFNYDNALEYNGDKVETQMDRDALTDATDDCNKIKGFIEKYNGVIERSFKLYNETKTC